MTHFRGYRIPWLFPIRPNVKVVLSSGYNELEAVRQFTGKGLAGFIQKPYAAAGLAQKVKTVLEANSA